MTNHIAKRCVLSILAFLVLGSRIVSAADFNYHFSVEKPIQHYVVKPDFESIQTDIKVKNYGDPTYVRLESSTPKELQVDILDVTSSQLGTKLEPAYLLSSQETKTFQLTVRRKEGVLGSKDYTIDVAISQNLPQKPTYSQQSVLIKPVIHAYTILSGTIDGNTPLNPKIAIFQNIGGPVILANRAAAVMLMVQNRSEYLFPIQGTATLTDSSGNIKRFEIPPTYIFSNSQKYLTTKNSTEGKLFSIQPDKLSTGVYEARAELTIPGKNTPSLYGQAKFLVVSPIVIVVSLIFLIVVVVCVFYIGLRHT